MAKPFEVIVEQPLDATPEEAWQAITTGAAIDSWFMGTNSIEPRLGGALRTELGGFALESTITAWEPPYRFVHTTPEGDDGRLMTFAYEIEGRGGTTVLRFVHSGFLPDAEWADEFDALKIGDPAYVAKLAEYLRYFKGRTAIPVGAVGPQVDAERAWSTFTRELGLPRHPSEGDTVHARLDGLPALDGVVDYVSPEFLGVRTSDGMYRFIHGLGGAIVLGHHVFADVDRAATQQAWQAWVDRAFA